MTDKLAFWLEGIVEDDPLPDEINIIVFKLNFNGNYKYLEVIGLENELNLNGETYRPLEAQFFSLKDIMQKKDATLIFLLKTAIDDAFSSPILKQQYKKRKIYLYINLFEFMFEV